ncbi:MAG: restriction endonuclease subunit S, partial [Alphaproteobacteria bacterium]|nr:restriction endonuclease subunit S [Alphaproteobacteria bacterium]
MSDIPNGWQKVRLGNVCDINKHTISKNSAPLWIDYIDISSISTRQCGKPSRMMYSESPSRAKRLIVEPSIIISTVRPNLKQYAFIKEPTENLVASTGFSVLTSNGKANLYYLYNIITSKKYTKYLVGIADGAVYPSFRPNVLADLKINLPSLEEQKRIA